MTSINQIPSDLKKTFSRYINWLGYIGLGFFDESPNGRTMEHLKLFSFCITFLPFTAVQFSLIFKIESDNLLEGVRSIPISFVFTFVTLKMIIAFTKRVQIREMLVEIGSLWPKDLNEVDEKSVVMKNWLRRMNILLNSWFIIVLANISLFVIVPPLVTFYNVYNEVDKYYYPFQLFESWEPDSILIYLVFYTWEVVSAVPSQLCLYFPFDLLIIVFTSDISILFRLLRIDLENAIEAADDAETRTQISSVSDDESCGRIKSIIVVHQKLLRLADRVTGIFGIVIFIHIIFSSVIICFFGFFTVIYGGQAESIPNLLSVCNSIATIFLLSLAGQLLSETSNDIGDAAYRSAWYKSDNEVTKLIKIIMLRAHRPSYLSALGFSDLTLRSFSKIMSTAWTYFTLLIQLYSVK